VYFCEFPESIHSSFWYRQTARQVENWEMVKKKGDTKCTVSVAAGAVFLIILNRVFASRGTHNEKNCMKTGGFRSVGSFEVNIRRAHEYGFQSSRFSRNNSGFTGFRNPFPRILQNSVRNDKYSGLVQVKTTIFPQREKTLGGTGQLSTGC